MGRQAAHHSSGLLIAGVGVLITLGRAARPAARAISPIRRGNFTFYFPLTTSILASILLTLVHDVLRETMTSRTERTRLQLDAVDQS